MTKIIMNGCNGKMGQVISRLVAEDEDVEIVCGVDINTTVANPYPVVSSIEEFDGEADVVIDFSHPSCLPSILSYCKRTKTPVVLATTGFSAEEKTAFTEASKEIPVFFSANMSLGINLLISLAKQAAKLLEGNFDIEIVERHRTERYSPCNR